MIWWGYHDKDYENDCCSSNIFSFHAWRDVLPSPEWTATSHLEVYSSSTISSLASAFPIAPSEFSESTLSIVTLGLDNRLNRILSDKIPPFCCGIQPSISSRYNEIRLLTETPTFCCRLHHFCYLRVETIQLAFHGLPRFCFQSRLKIPKKKNKIPFEDLDPD